MSSVSTPFGFRPVYHNSGQARAKAYTIASGYSSNIFSGDPVKLTDAGTIQLATSDGSRTGTTDGVFLLGIFGGVQYIDSTGKPSHSPFWPANTSATGIVAWVYDDPETIFEVQYNNPGAAGTNSVQSDVGEECDWVANAPGSSTQTGQSATLLTGPQQPSGQFQIVGFAPLVGDSLTDAFVVARVRINEHHYKAPVNAI